MTYDAFWMRHTLGNPQSCTEEVTRKGQLDTCDKVAVALRLDPEEGDPYTVCAKHSRAPMVPLEAIVRFMLDRQEGQRLAAERLIGLGISDPRYRAPEADPKGTNQ